MAVLWVVTPCGHLLVQFRRNRLNPSSGRKDRGSKFLRNTGIYLHVHKALQPRTMPTASPPWETQISSVLLFTIIKDADKYLNSVQQGPNVRSLCYLLYQDTFTWGIIYHDPQVLSLTRLSEIQYAFQNWCCHICHWNIIHFITALQDGCLYLWPRPLLIPHHSQGWTVCLISN